MTTVTQLCILQNNNDYISTKVCRAIGLAIMYFFSMRSVIGPQIKKIALISIVQCNKMC